MHNKGKKAVQVPAAEHLPDDTLMMSAPGASSGSNAWLSSTGPAVLTARVVSYVGLSQAALTRMPALLTCRGSRPTRVWDLLVLGFDSGDCVDRQGGVICGLAPGGPDGTACIVDLCGGAGFGRVDSFQLWLCAPPGWRCWFN